MTTARELHDNWIDITDTNRALMAGDPENGETILRALDLLARVEEEKDDIVIELRFDAKDLRRWGRVDHAETLDNAAAALVALKENKDLAHEALATLEKAYTKLHDEVIAIKAERDALIAKWAPVEAFKAAYDKAYDKDAP